MAINQKVMHVFKSEEDGYEVHVINHDKGYAVQIYDTDSKQYFPSVQIFPSELYAYRVATSIAGGYEYDHSKPVVVR